MNREEIIRRLKRIASHAVHVIGEEPYAMSLDDGIAASEAALLLLKEQPKIIRCKDCEYWVPGVITDQDDFIPPKCGKYSQMVGHSADDFCSLAKQEAKK